jgi:hypothetical protein
MRRVSAAFCASAGPIGFVPKSNGVPAVLSQPGKTMEDKQIAAREDMLERYSRYLREEGCLLGPMAKDWVAERLAGIENQLSVLHPNRLAMRSLTVPRYVLTLQTIRIRCPKYQSHPWEIIQKLHLGDVVREAVPLEVQTIFQGSVQVHFAVQPSGISMVLRLCELVEFRRLSEDDPIIQMQPDGEEEDASSACREKKGR